MGKKKGKGGQGGSGDKAPSQQPPLKQQSQPGSSSKEPFHQQQRDKKKDSQDQQKAQSQSQCPELQESLQPASHQQKRQKQSQKPGQPQQQLGSQQAWQHQLPGHQQGRPQQQPEAPQQQPGPQGQPQGRPQQQPVASQGWPQRQPLPQGWPQQQPLPQGLPQQQPLPPQGLPQQQPLPPQGWSQQQPGPQQVGPQQGFPTGMHPQQRLPPQQQFPGIAVPPGLHPQQMSPHHQTSGMGLPTGLNSKQTLPPPQQAPSLPKQSKVEETGDPLQQESQKKKSRSRGKGKGKGDAQQQASGPQEISGKPQQEPQTQQQSGQPLQQERSQTLQPGEAELHQISGRGKALQQPVSGGDAPEQQEGRGRTTQQQVGGGDAPHQQGVKGHITQKPAPSVDVTKQVSQMRISPGKDIKPMEFIVAKPGIKGRKIMIETNHLPLNLGKLDTAIHYDVAIDPDTPKKFLRTVMELCRKKYYPNRYPAFDGRKNLYSSKMLDFGTNMSGEVVYCEGDRQKLYKIEIKFAKKVDLKTMRNYELSRAVPQDALQVIDIVLRSAPASSLIPVGRSFFVKPPQIIDLGEGMEMYHGFYQSAIRGWKPFLNVDVAHKAFPKSMPVVDALMDVLSSRFNQFTRDNLSRPLDRRDAETFEKFIKTLRVIYEIPGIPSSRRGYRINALSEPAGRKTFKLDNGQQMTIEQYFAKEKRYKLKYPAMPTLWVGDKQRPNPILLPMELCTLEQGQVLNRKMTENQTANMIKSSATNTDIRKKKIHDGVSRANYNAHPAVKEFGFSVSDVFEKLDARVLVPPKLGYNKNEVTPSKGVWRGGKFLTGATINNWTIVAADRRRPRDDDFHRLAEELFRNAAPSGLIMNSRAQEPFDTIGSTLPEIKKYFQNQKGKYDVIFVMVPNSGQQYSYVKTAAEINVGCLTQCIKLRTVGRINVQTAVNILLKVNAKLNGVNHCLSTRPLIMNKPTMIMGADVTHPSPDSRDIPSVAAVTASHDPKAFKYNICWRLQPPKQEVIDDFENITLEHLRYFYEKTGVKPVRIIVFRDGVSEGYFEEIRRAEIRAIRSACKKIQADDYEPAITFLVVQKRHHTRLFPLNPRDSEDRNNNVPAGTCVDHQITHPFMQDFYLVSHASIQGVAKPTKYCTLWDDNNLTNDDIEELTYFLCHMFTRCNRSVSYPAPTYYAHLAAARAKVYIENDRLDLDNLKRECEKFKILDVIRKDRPMFFV